ncbi:MAG: hypothetical protein E6Q97_37470 [Desulfurellales bacterium]|nr:MAG: hypothetical protein E6Q97_37470 [Desulfurellales bacterium]
MANKTFYGVKSRGRERVDICGSFAPNGSSAVSSASVKGAGFTVVRDSAGLFKVTLEETFPNYDCVLVTLQENSAATTNFVKLQGAVDLSTNKTFYIANAPGGTLTDIAANANNRIHFRVCAKNTSVGS